MLSVVIATLGGGSLAETLAQLNRGTLIPEEILVCIPEAEAPRVKHLQLPNLRVVVTDCRGQVNQRIRGFAQAKHDLVMQIDDDVLVRPDCLRLLADFCETHPRSSVAPKLIDRKTRKYHEFLVPRQPRPSLMDRLKFLVINGRGGYAPGQISLSGVNMGLPECPDDWFDLGWLPGGCVMHRKENLILTPFYPFPGKAFAEDLFHTRELRRHGVRLDRCGAACCDLDLSSSGLTSPAQFIKDYAEYGRRMRVFVEGNGGSLWRLRAFLVLNVFDLLFRRLTRRRTST